MKPPFKLIAIPVLAAAAPLASAATISYDFTGPSAQGWTNVQTSTTGPTAFAAQDTSTAALYDTGALGPTLHVSRDAATSVALWARSPLFSFDGSGNSAITFDLRGGGADTTTGGAPASSADTTLFSTATTSGWRGMVLRRVSDGAFILNASKATSGDGAESLSFSAAAINGATAGDASGSLYSLDLIDSKSGTWGWIVTDNVTLTNVVPEPSALMLSALGSLALLRRRR